MYSYWGQVDYKVNIMRGVIEVGTPSHGGILVSPKLAEKYIPSAILERIPLYNHYYSFEEDCNWAIPCYFIPNLLVNRIKTLNRAIPYDDYKELVLNSIKQWNSDCLNYGDVL
jgi:hypothetical protein